jgi:hypothetical protein
MDNYLIHMYVLVQRHSLLDFLFVSTALPSVLNV